MKLLNLNCKGAMMSEGAKALKRAYYMGKTSQAPRQLYSEAERRNQEFQEARAVYPTLVYGGVMWEYAHRVTDYCRANRIEATRKLSRALAALEEHYNKTLRACLSGPHMAVLHWAINDMLEVCANELYVISWTVRNNLQKNYTSRTEEISHIDLRVAAAVVQLMGRSLDEVTSTSHMPMATDLRVLTEMMEGYLSDYGIELTQPIKDALAVMRNQIRTVQTREVTRETLAGVIAHDGR